MVLHPILEEKLNAALDLKAQGHAVSKDSAHALHGHLTDACLLQAVPVHTACERQRNSNPRKIYLADAAKAHSKLPAMLLVLTQEQVIALVRSGLRAMPAYEWMLRER